MSTNRSNVRWRLAVLTSVTLFLGLVVTTVTLFTFRVSQNTRIQGWVFRNYGLLAYDSNPFTAIGIPAEYCSSPCLIEVSLEFAPDLLGLADAPTVRDLTILIPDGISTDLAPLAELISLEHLTLESTPPPNLATCSLPPSLRTLTLYTTKPTDHMLDELHKANPNLVVRVHSEYHPSSRPLP